ncbi:MAG: hypothetical protein K0R76_856 [Alphaproteobacteria bacterium]|jgi:hypothetical protein|nr:hypothetical protein [Alphaproteobacteria bacterium]
MKRFSISAFLLSATALTAIPSAKGEAPQNSPNVAQELLDLKRQIKESHEKIRNLEAHFHTKGVKTSSVKGQGPDMAQALRDIKRQVEKTDEKVRRLEARFTAKSFDNSLGKNKSQADAPYTWPARYLSVPQTNSAIQLIVNPNLAISYDFSPFSGDVISPTTLPLAGVDGNASKSGRFNTQAKGTQFGFRTLSFTNIGEVKSEISLDFYGSTLDTTGIPAAYQPRLRFAFIEFSGFTIGQTTSNFLDMDAIGETVDYGTVFEGAFRHPLVKYAFNINKQISLGLAAERSVTDYTTPSTDSTGTIASSTNSLSATSLPDFTAHLKYTDFFGHVALRGVLRELKVKNYSNAGQPAVAQSFRKTGWGLGVSGKLFIHKKTSLFAQVNFGDGIGRFIILCNGQSAFYNPTTNIFDRQKAMDGILGLEHFWTDSFRSNIIFARTKVNVSKYTPAFTGTTRVTESINQFFLNLIYSPTPPLDLGIEYGFANRRTADAKRGKANRITLGMVYKF